MSQAITTARDLPAPSASGAPAATRDTARLRRRTVRLVLMIGGIVVAAVGSLLFWLNGGRYVSVDNAYIRADKLIVATDVSGLVAEVRVREAQQVRRGDVLFRLDDRQYRIALEGAEANLAETRLQLEAMRRDYERMLRDVAAKRAQVAMDQARFDRVNGLVHRGDVSRQAYDDARFQLEADQQNYESTKAAAQVQLARLGGDSGAELTELPAYKLAQARVNEARRQLDHATVAASIDGVATGVDNLQPGQYLSASAGAFGLVSTSQLWVAANPKETELTRVKPGDPVRIAVDTYPGRSWTGTVDSIAPASGSAFSILPAQNSSGNWVKVVQRIPVRIRVQLQAGDPPLREGMSVEATIDTGHTRSLRDLF